MSKQILILTSDAGFGHRRAAQAIQAAFEEKYVDDCVVAIDNPLQDPGIPDLIRSVETGYDDMVVDDPTLYQLTYMATDAPVVARLIQEVTTTVLNETLKGMVRKHQPDAIVTTYPAYTHAAIKASKEVEIPAPVDVVVTDLISVHSLWFHKGADVTFVPTGNVYKKAVEHELDKSKIQLTGLPVHPDVVRETGERPEVREKLGWEKGLTTALIVGSSRTRDTVSIARLLDQSGLNIQIVAVAGGDTESEERLKNTTWKSRHVHTYGYVDNMPQMMRAADFIICKAGGLIVTEALACGLPLILYEALPGQEEGNVRYVTEAGAGAWSPGSIGVLTTAYAWLTNDKAELKQVRANAKRIGKPRAAYDVADYVMRQIK